MSTDTHREACEPARPYRAARDDHGDANDRTKAALGHAAGGCRAAGRACGAAVHECSRRDIIARRRPGSSPVLPGRIDTRRPLVWVRQDFSETRESGALSMSVALRIGLDPCLVVTVHAPTEPTSRCGPPPMRWPAMRSAPWCWKSGDEARLLDLVASRRLTWRHRPPALPDCCCGWRRSRCLRPPETRWIVRAAHSPAGASWQAWGAPVLDTQLVRNRHGPIGRWIMEWKCDECLFSDVPFHGSETHPQPVAAAAARSYQARVIALRRAG